MYQQTTIVGNLGKDPEMRFTPDGTPVCNFNVAVNRRWTNGDGTTGEKTTWFRVTVWRKLAEICNQYLSKGRLVMVVGEIDASAFMPEQGGSPRASLELTARDVKFLGGSNGNGNGSSTGNGAPAYESEDIPF